ncbi:MAG TPA: head GIN domain-containing protein [Gammaproteobacteria bacterium]
MKIVVASAVLLASIGASAAAVAQTETRQVPPFSKLSVDSGIDVELRQTDRENLRIEVDGVALADVESVVVDDELRLSRTGWKSRIVETARVRAYVDFVSLTSIVASSGSDIESNGALEAEDLTVTASSGSDVELEIAARSLALEVSSGSDVEVGGTVDSFSVAASSGSDVSAGGLEARDVTLRLSSGSDAEVRATGSVDIEASSGSDVTVYGNPATRNVDTDRSSDVAWR